jgi:hypothetical protein
MCWTRANALEALLAPRQADHQGALISDLTPLLSGWGATRLSHPHTIEKMIMLRWRVEIEKPTKGN